MLYDVSFSHNAQTDYIITSLANHTVCSMTGSKLQLRNLQSNTCLRNSINKHCTEILVSQLLNNVHVQNAPFGVGGYSNFIFQQLLILSIHVHCQRKHSVYIVLSVCTQESCDCRHNDAVLPTRHCFSYYDDTTDFYAYNLLQIKCYM